MSEQTETVSAEIETIEADAFKLAYAVIATLKGEPARCTKRSCRQAGHCTAAADGQFCNQPGVWLMDSLAHAGREFLLRHAHRHPLRRP